MKKKVKVGDEVFDVTSDDEYLKNMGDDFEPHMVALFKALINKDDVIADVGANIGLTSMLFSQLGSKVISFEASPSTYQIFDKNMKINNINNVVPVNIGLGSENENSTITFGSNNRSGGFVSDQIRPVSGHTTEEITIKRLDDIWDSKFNESLDFIKLDVEGFEGNVIQGACKVLEKYKPIVVLELNHWCLNAFRRMSVPEFFDILKSHFPYLYAIDTDNKKINDLYDNDQAYEVLHNHIVHFHFPNIVACYDQSIREKLNSL